MRKKIIVDNKNSGLRLDLFLNKKLSKFSRNSIKKMITSNNVLINKKPQKPSYKIKAADEIDIKIQKNKTIDIKPEEGELEIIYEDKNLFVINKPDNLIVHPTLNKLSKTLVNRLLNYYPKITEATFDQSITSKLRPGIVHRLDKDTSGLIIVAKNKKSLEYLSKEFKKHRVKKIYCALVYGWPPKSGELISKIERNKKKRIIMSEGLEGKIAISNFITNKYYKTTNDDKVALVKIQIKTGRTHQIRLQFKNSGFPILGDKKYFIKNSQILSQKLEIQRQMLHACAIEFQSQTGKKIKQSISLPKDFLRVINKLTID